MIITQTSDNIQINISKKLDSKIVQRIIDYIQYLEISSKSSNLKQKDADYLSDEINDSWWKKNKQRFIK